MRNLATKSTAGLLPIGNEEDYQRTNEALQEGRLFDEMVCSVYFLNVFLGHLSRDTGRLKFECLCAKRDGRYFRPKLCGSHQEACHICRIQASGGAAWYIHLLFFFKSRCAQASKVLYHNDGFY